MFSSRLEFIVAMSFVYEDAHCVTCNLGTTAY